MHDETDSLKGSVFRKTLKVFQTCDSNTIEREAFNILK